MSRSVQGSLRQPASWPNSTRECGITTCWAWGPSCKSTDFVSLPPSFTEVSRGPHTPDKRSGSTGSTFAAFGVSFRSNGVSNTIVLQRADLPSIPTLLIQRRLRWLGHVHRMEPDRLSRQVLYGELWEGARRVSQPLLRFKDVCKRDLRLADLNPNSWEVLAQDRDVWRHGVKEGALRAETKARAEATIKRRERNDKYQFERPPTTSLDTSCNKDCHSRIGLLSQSRACRHWCADHRLSETRMPMMI